MLIRHVCVDFVFDLNLFELVARIMFVCSQMVQDSGASNVDRAVSRYSSLFTLTSYRNIAALLAASCVIAGFAAVLPLDFSAYGLAFSLIIAAALFFATFLGDYLSVGFFLKGDPILNLRRFSFLSFASNMFLFIFVFAANLVLAYSGDQVLWVKVVSVGLFAAVCLRFLVLCSVSSVGFLRATLSVLVQPALFVALASVVPLSSFAFQAGYFAYLFAAVFMAFLAVQVLVASLNVVGTAAVGVPSLKLFKAFLADWIEGLEKPFEEILEQLSEERAVKVSLIAFSSGGKPKAVVVVPGIHPGPFKNIGSSSIPSLIQEAIEAKCGCVVAVPHGISGHELDLPSQAQNEIVLKRLLAATEFGGFHACAGPFLVRKEGDATVGCQVFGDFALLTLTFAPATMEDLPLELNDAVAGEARKRGLAGAVAVDAHNSIEGSFDFGLVADSVEKAVAGVLDEAVNCEQVGFEVGAAKVVPAEFGVEEGMGPGGITVVVVKVGGQRAAYVTVDGNNMVPGLREKILSSLEALGIDGGEVFTTDTHRVNAVALTKRGYFPVGERIDHDMLIAYVKVAAEEALRNLEPAEVSWRLEEISGVKTIGERQIDNLSAIADTAAKKTKRNSAIIFPTFTIILTILLALM